MGGYTPGGAVTAMATTATRLLQSVAALAVPIPGLAGTRARRPPTDHSGGQVAGGCRRERRGQDHADQGSVPVLRPGRGRDPGRRDRPAGPGRAGLAAPDSRSVPGLPAIRAVRQGQHRLRRHPPRRGRLLVLDEPTASLDARAEAAFYDQFLDLTRDTTTIVISHRFSTVRRADLICVLAGGAVAELGPHAELLAAGGHYARMYTAQSARFTGTAP